MSYQHIDNLYKSKDILSFRTCYAMEKIHGTSAHVGWNNGQVHFFAGGTNHNEFIKLFDAEELKKKFEELGQPKVTVYGEAYGGKIMKMRETYGPNMKFIAFEVMVGDSWLSVPQAEEVVNHLGLEFVHYREINTDLETLDAERNADSVQAIRNGMEEGHKREGIVLRPPFEVTLNNGKRIIAKYKAEAFSETATPRKVNKEHIEKMTQADAIAQEWVTPMRLQHVADGIELCLENIGKIIQTMTADIEREAAGEVEITPEVKKKIGSRTAEMIKKTIKENLQHEN